MARLTLIVMGAAAFAVPSLEAVLGAGHRVAAVYSQPPRPAGRGMVARPTPLVRAAMGLGLGVLTPETLDDPAEHEALARLAPDAIVVVAYGLILPKPVLAVPRLGCLNVHPSLLPRWRGAAPVARAIEAGDAETGVTIMLMDEGLDSGLILLAERVPMPADATTPALEADLAGRGARLLTLALDGLAAGTLVARPQPELGASYARKLKRAEARLDWSQPADVLERRVRAFQPWPGAHAVLGGQIVKVIVAEVSAGAAAPGTLLDDGLTVACGTGALRLVRVQRLGGRATDGAAFLRGARLRPGARFA